MITYKVSPVFDPNWESLYKSLFGDAVHSATNIENNVGVFSFEDDSVTPADLGPLVKVEVVTG